MISSLVQLLNEKRAMENRVEELKRSIDELDAKTRDYVELIDNDEDKTLALMLTGQLYYALIEPWDHRLKQHIIEALKKHEIDYTLNTIDSKHGKSYELMVHWPGFDVATIKE